jgi:hypothetical protein
MDLKMKSLKFARFVSTVAGLSAAMTIAMAVALIGLMWIAELAAQTFPAR